MIRVLKMIRVRAL